MSEAWAETSLGDVAEVNPREPALPEDAPFITMADVAEWGRWAHPSGPKGSRGGARARGGDVLMARITPCLENGKIAMVPTDLGRVGGSTELLVLRAGQGLLSEFLFLWAVSRSTHSAAVGLMTGTTGRQRVNASDIAALPILLPPLSVQRRIVDLVAHMDTNIANLRAEWVALQEMLHVARQDVTSTWPLVPLEVACSIEASLVDPRLPDFRTLPHIGIEQMVKNGGDLRDVSTAEEDSLISSKFHFGPQDVIISKIRPNLRKVVFPGFSGLCSADAYPLRPKEDVPPELLRELLLLPSVTTALVTKSGRTKMPKVNRQQLFQISVPLTVDVQERSEASSLLAAIRGNVRHLAGEIQSVMRLRKSLLAGLMTNEVKIEATYDAFLEQVA